MSDREYTTEVHDGLTVHRPVNGEEWTQEEIVLLFENKHGYIVPDGAEYEDAKEDYHA